LFFGEGGSSISGAREVNRSADLRPLAAIEACYFAPHNCLPADDNIADDNQLTMIRPS
jgi:hypothetical protein